MRLEDGFIVDVWKYCDRWCSQCALCKRCRLFVEGPQEPSDGRTTFDGLDPKCLPVELEPSFRPDPEVVARSASLRRKAQRARLSASASVRLAQATLEYGPLFIMVTMMRALAAVSRGENVGRQSMANGYGKAALVLLQQMRASWSTLVNTRHFSELDVAPFLREIARMERNVDRIAPDARAFIRPGFDEMDEVRALETPRTLH